MIQRISVRIRVMSGDRTLLVRRAEGRTSILGKHELPGGRVKQGEQPEDTAKRYLSDNLGIDANQPLMLDDVMTYADSDDRDVQYAVIVYRISVSRRKRAIMLSQHYDKYTWYTFGKLDKSEITEVSQLVLGTIAPMPHEVAEVVAATDSDSKQANAGAFLYTDGGSRGNPGPSAAGYVIIQGDRVVDEGGEYLGITTNNQAEYHGVRVGLEAAVRLGIQELEVRVDSMLVANQLNGIYKIKNRELWPVNERVRELTTNFKKIKFTHVPRELNQLADGMVNRTLDRQKSGDVL